MTKEKAYKLHYRMWDWLSKNPQCDKMDWPEWRFNGGKTCRAQYLCFLCEVHRDGDNCIECPLGDCKEAGSLFALWRDADSNAKSRRRATVIRDAVLAEKGG